MVIQDQKRRRRRSKAKAKIFHLRRRRRRRRRQRFQIVLVFRSLPPSVLGTYSYCIRLVPDGAFKKISVFTLAVRLCALQADGLRFVTLPRPSVHNLDRTSNSFMLLYLDSAGSTHIATPAGFPPIFSRHRERWCSKSLAREYLKMLID
jgi:hypothetical protein